jgi:hypothetical protein
MAKQKIKKMKEHDDEVEDKKLVKKMVKGDCLNDKGGKKKRK